MHSPLAALLVFGSILWSQPASTLADEQSAIDAITFARGRVTIDTGTTFVTFSFCDLTDQEAIAQVAKLERVKVFQAMNSQFDPRELAVLVSQKETLCRVNLMNTATDDDALKHIGKLTELDQLGLAGTKVTAAGLAELKALPKLTRLDLGPLTFDEEVVAQLAELKTLKELSIGLTSKPPEDAEKKLREALPGCEISFYRKPAKPSEELKLSRFGLPAYLALSNVVNAGCGGWADRTARPERLP